LNPCAFVSAFAIDLWCTETTGHLIDKHLSGLDLTAITRERLDRIGAARQSEGVTLATVNRVVEVLRAILKKCADDCERIDRAPNIRTLREPIRSARNLLREEAPTHNASGTNPSQRVK